MAYRSQAFPLGGRASLHVDLGEGVRNLSQEEGFRGLVVEISPGMKRIYEAVPDGLFYERGVRRGRDPIGKQVGQLSFLMAGAEKGIGHREAQAGSLGVEKAVYLEEPFPGAAVDVRAEGQGRPVGIGKGAKPEIPRRTRV